MKGVADRGNYLLYPSPLEVCLLFPSNNRRLLGGVAREVRCWCYCAKKMVTVRGEIIGRRAADLLKIVDCVEVDCLLRGEPDCLVGNVRESRWP